MKTTEIHSTPSRWRYLDQWLNDLNLILLGNKFIKNLNKGCKRVSKSYKQPKIKDVKK